MLRGAAGLSQDSGLLLSFSLCLSLHQLLGDTWNSTQQGLRRFRINSRGIQPQSLGTAPPPPIWSKAKAKFGQSRMHRAAGHARPPALCLRDGPRPKPQLPSQSPAALQRPLPAEHQVVPSTFHPAYPGWALILTFRLVLNGNGQFIHTFLPSFIHSFRWSTMRQADIVPGTG